MQQIITFSHGYNDKVLKKTQTRKFLFVSNNFVFKRFGHIDENKKIKST